MTILLCLFEEEDEMSDADISVQSDCTQRLGNLPTTQTEMYRKFILMTINRSVKKEKQSSDSLLLKDLSDLPEPHNKVFEDLCQLAFNALRADKIVFEFDEIKNICPNLTMTPDSWSGLGLLKAVRFVNTVSFHFLHFSIQEYLATYHIASLSNSAQINLLKRTFWEIRYYNTWIMYVGITGGNKFAWKHFISGNWFQLSTWLFGTSAISRKLLGDKVKCLHLFQCYAEVGGHEDIRKLFDGQVLDLSNQTMLPKDLNTLGFFLLRSSEKKWEYLNLSNCSIGVAGCNILRQQFWNKSTRQIVSFKNVNFSNNQLHFQSVLTLMDVFKAWHISEAVIDNRHIGIGNEFLLEVFLNKFLEFIDETLPQIISVGPYLFAHRAKQEAIQHHLTRPTKYDGLYLRNCEWDMNDAEMKGLSTALLMQNVNQIHIAGNALAGHILRDIVATNFSSVFVCDYTLPNEYLDNIADVLQWIPDACSWLLIGCNKTLGHICNSTQNQQLPTSRLLELLVNVGKIQLNSPLDISDKLESFSFFYGHKCVFQGLVQFWHSEHFKGQTNLCLVENNVLIAHKVNFTKVLESCAYFLTFICIVHCNITTSVISNLVSEQVSFLYIFKCHLDTQFVSRVCIRWLDHKPPLKELFIHTTNSHCTITPSVLALLSSHHNTSTVLLTKDTLACQKPSREQIVFALQLEPMIKIWKFGNCYLNAETYYHIADLLTNNATNLIVLDVSACGLGECELDIFSAYLKKKMCKLNLKVLNMSYNNANKGIGTLCSVLSLTNKLKKLDLSYNKLQTADIVRILKPLIKMTSMLNSFDISHNNITDRAAQHIAGLLSHTTTLHTLGLSSCLQSTGAVEILKGLENISTLTTISFSNNRITDSEVNYLEVILCHNDKLKELDLSCNCLQAVGTIQILKQIKNIVTLKKLVIADNGITNEAADYIAVVLSHNSLLEEVDLSNNNLQEAGALKLLKTIKDHSKVKKFNISHNNITDSATDKLTTLLTQSNSNVENLSFMCRKLPSRGLMETFCAVESPSKLDTLMLSCNCYKVCDNSVNGIAVILSCDFVSDLSYNSLQPANVIKSLRGKKLNLTKVCFSHVYITAEVADDLAVVLTHSNKLEQLILSHNDLQTARTMKIFQGLQNLSNLKHVNISNNNIDHQAASVIVVALSHSTNLEELDLSCNTLQAVGFLKVLVNTLTLKRLNFHNNRITDEAANDIAAILFQNTTLEEVDLSFNSLRKAGILEILQVAQTCLNLKNFDFSYNDITVQAADEIVNTLSPRTKYN